MSPSSKNSQNTLAPLSEACKQALRSQVGGSKMSSTDSSAHDVTSDVSAEPRVMGNTPVTQLDPVVPPQEASESWVNDSFTDLSISVAHPDAGDQHGAASAEDRFSKHKDITIKTSISVGPSSVPDGSYASDSDDDLVVVATPESETMPDAKLPDTEAAPSTTYSLDKLSDFVDSETPKGSLIARLARQERLTRTIASTVQQMQSDQCATRKRLDLLDQSFETFESEHRASMTRDSQLEELRQQYVNLHSSYALLESDQVRNKRELDALKKVIGADSDESGYESDEQGDVAVN